jgi:hypothetical protein
VKENVQRRKEGKMDKLYEAILLFPFTPVSSEVLVEY